MKPGAPAGFAKIDITPPLERLEVFGLGYWFERRVRFTGVRDPLFARAAVLGDQVIVSVDAIFDSYGFSPQASAAIAHEFAIPEENVFIACTHTHSAPLIGLNRTPDGSEYGRYVSDRIVACVRKAFRNRAALVPAVSRVSVSGVLYNRRPVLKNGSIAELHVPLDPDTVADPGMVNDTMTVLKYRTTEGELAGGLCHFGIHGVTIQCSDLLSSDCMGRAIQTFEAGTGAVMLHLNGACGDIDPAAMGDVAALEATGARLHHALRCAHGAPESPVSTLPQRSLRGCYRARRRPVRSPDELLERERILSDGGLNLSHHSGPGYQRFLLEEERAVASLPDEFDIPYQVLRSGGVVFLGVGGEIFTEFGNRLISLGGNLTVLPVGITGAWRGYLPPERAFAQGGYEVAAARWCPIAPGETEKLFAAIERDLRFVYDDSTLVHPHL